MITNRKSHKRFQSVLRSVPKSATLDDPELTLNGYYDYSLSASAVTPKINDLEWSFCVKICFGLVI